MGSFGHFLAGIAPFAVGMGALAMVALGLSACARPLAEARVLAPEERAVGTPALDAEAPADVETATFAMG